MPLCKEHGQVYGEGGQCIVCDGGTPRHEAEILPTALSQDDRNAYEEALDALDKRVAALEAKLQEEE